MQVTVAVVPYYFLVWYNTPSGTSGGYCAVVPYYFLVWYNKDIIRTLAADAVVPYYFLVWYNRTATTPHNHRDYAGFLF